MYFFFFYTYCSLALNSELLLALHSQVTTTRLPLSKHCLSCACSHKHAKLNIHTSQIANPCCIYWKAVLESYSSDCWKSFLLQASSTSVLILVLLSIIFSKLTMHMPFGYKTVKQLFSDPSLSDGVSRQGLFWGAAVWQSMSLHISQCFCTVY